MISTNYSLLERLKNGNEIAFSVFYRTYKPFAMKIGKKHGLTTMECEDMVQQTMLSIFNENSVMRYDASLGPFRSYLSGIIRKHVFQQFRKRPQDSAAAEDMEETLCGEFSEDMFESVFKEEYRSYMIELMLDELRHQVEHRTFEAFQLSVLLEHTPQEVAEALGMSVSNVYLSVSRCRNRLKKIRADVMKSDPEFYI